jgi:hypothetical protein
MEGIMTGTVKLGKRELYRPINALKDAAKIEDKAQKETLLTSIYTEVMSAFNASPVESLKNHFALGGANISHLSEALSAEQKKELLSLLKSPKNAEFYNLPHPITISYTETELAKLVGKQENLKSETEGFTAGLIRLTASAAQKEPIAKNAPQRPHGEALRIITTDYPTAYNEAATLIDAHIGLHLEVQETRKKIFELLDDAQKKITEKMVDVASLSKELSIEKNNYDNHDKYMKDWSSKYPSVQTSTADVKPAEWILDNFSKLLEQTNKSIRDAEALMLSRGQKCMKQLTGRRHSMQQSIARTEAFQAKDKETTVLYGVVQAQLQNAFNALNGLSGAVQQLNAQINDKLDVISKESRDQIQTLVTTFKDYTEKANALVPYTLTEEIKKRELPVLKAEGNQLVALEK